MSHYGKKSVAQDGKTYRSKFEADFVDKFLIPSGLEYVYEVAYPNSKMTCDFWLPKYDIWIECAYHYAAMRYNYEKFPHGRRINLPKVSFHDKDYVKTQKARWDPLNKVWYVSYEGSQFANLHRFMSESDLATVYDTDGKAMIKGYDERLLNKILDRKCNVLIVNKEDLKFNDLAHLICAKENLIVLKNIAAKSLGYDRNDGVGKNLGELYNSTQSALMSLEISRQKMEEDKKKEDDENQKMLAKLKTASQQLDHKQQKLKKQMHDNTKLKSLLDQMNEGHQLNQKESHKLTILLESLKK